MKSEEAEADIADIDIAAEAWDGGCCACCALAVAVAVPPLSNLIMVSFKTCPFSKYVQVLSFHILHKSKVEKTKFDVKIE